MTTQRNVYCFISDENKKFYRAKQQPNGTYSISSNAQPYPITYNPSNLLKCQVEFATNATYFSMARSINYPLDFIKDGAAILRSLFYLGKTIEQKCYLTIVEWNGVKNIYELSYYGRIDLSQKDDKPKAGIFTVPCIDDSAWGVLSQNDSVEYSIDCSATNPKAIKVLIDAVTLVNKYTYQTVQAPMVHFADGTGLGQYNTMPFIQVNQDGDSAGVLTSNQSYLPIAIASTPDAGGSFWIKDPQQPGYFFLTQYALPNFNITGNITFNWSSDDNFGGGAIMIMSNQKHYPATGTFAIANVIADFSKGLVKGKTYSFDFDFTLNLDPDERLFLIICLNSGNDNHFTITPITSNSFITTKTSTQPVICYGLRPLDYLKQLVSKATYNRFTIDSNYFTVNNKSIITSGDAIRGLPNAKIYGSFKDFFQTFNAIFFLALRVVNGDLFIEKATEVYKNSGTMIDLGDAIDVSLAPATDYYGNEIEVGSPKQDYRHPSGRLEFNSVNTFSLPILTVNKKLSYITKYRLGCYDVIFLILDYQGQSTQDNSGDKSVYLLDISDEEGYAIDDIETFENVTIDNSPLEPIIKTPFNNDVINNDKPVIRGIAPAGQTVNIYADNVLDGGTVADANGNWSYVLVNSLSSYEQGVHTGIHVIDAVYTDESAPKSSITVTIDTTVTTDTVISYPGLNDSLYNNLPLIKGVSQFGTVLDILLDGVSIGTVTADQSCKWELQSPLIPNGNHVITAGTATVPFIVDTNISFPLITYIGSQLDGFTVINNLPLIKGIAQPNTMVTLWLNYISYKPLGSVRSDANGNWSFQVVPVTYPDPISGIPQTLAPIINGANVISTSLINHTVPINSFGFKLNRPAFSSITGVTDNTVFNVNFSPKRMLLNQAPMLAAIGINQPNENIYFQTADKNGTLRTVLNGVVIAENADVPFSSLGSPLALLEYGSLKVKALKTFAQTLYDFSNGGIIKCNFKGTDLFFLPIGSMKIDNIASDSQDWKLLMSPLTTYQSLLNLYRNGLIINLNKNSMFHSDKNSLHFVTYGYTQPAEYNFKEIYDDWFSERNSAWIDNPMYIQKFQFSDPITDQVIVNGISGLTLNMFRCRDAVQIDSKNYVPVVPAPINAPNVVLEAKYDLSQYPEDQYFFILFVGTTMVAISERIQTKVKWDNTIQVVSSNSQNEVGFFYSTGAKTILRVEGLVKKWQPSINTIVVQEESGDTEILYAQNSRKRIIRFGTAYGLPDFLYLKIADALTNDNLVIEGVNYTLDADDKIEPSDEVDGHPLYYYNVNLTLSTNEKGKVFEVSGGGGGGTDINSVILVVDSPAVGLPAGSLINITLDNE